MTEAYLLTLTPPLLTLTHPYSPLPTLHRCYPSTPLLRSARLADYKTDVAQGLLRTLAIHLR